MKVEGGRAAWVKAWAGRVHELGLSPVAAPLLEVARAFGPLGSHLLLAAQPLLAGFADDASLLRVAGLLEDPELVDLFSAHLGGEEG